MEVCSEPANIRSQIYSHDLEKNTRQVGSEESEEENARGFGMIMEVCSDLANIGCQTCSYDSENRRQVGNDEQGEANVSLENDHAKCEEENANGIGMANIGCYSQVVGRHWRA